MPALSARTLDSNFTPEISNRDWVACHSLQADGRILIGGSSFSEKGGVISGLLARRIADGSVHATFLPRVDGMARSTALQPDGKLLVVGDFATINGVQGPGVARLPADGWFDSGFAPSFPAMLPPAYVDSLWILSSGKILIYRNVRTMVTGSNSSRNRLWKVRLQKLADELGLTLEVCDFPQGTSK